MLALKKYIDDSNKWLAIFGNEAEPFPTTLGQACKWYDSVENELSPENLFQDGEADPAKARARGDFLESVKRDLETLVKELEA